MEVRGTINRLVRRRNSKEGNPRFNVIMGEGVGSFTTKADAQVGFLIQSFEGKDVVLTLNERGEVIAVRDAVE